MKNLKTALIFVLTISCSLSLFSQNESEGHYNGVKLQNPISEAFIKKHLSKQSPKLILTPSTEKLLKQKLKTDTLVKTYYAFLKEEAFRILETPLLKLELEGFRFPDAREALRKLATLSIVYRIDKNPIILNRINEELVAISSFDSWNPQHFLDVSQTALGVALAIDWNANTLPKETIKLAKKALMEKAILPSFNTTSERMGWIDGSNNWNAVCHGGMIAASLAIADENPALAAKTISRALEKLPNSLKEYAPEGVHPEGPFYWRFGTSYTAVASNVLKTALGTDFGISKSPGFMQTADYRLEVTGPSGDCFNYADSDGKTDGDASAVLAWFAAQTGNGAYINKPFFEYPNNPDLLLAEEALIQQNEGRFAGVALIWLAQCSFENTTQLPQAWYGKGHVPIVVFRGDKDDTKQFYLAAKGGSGLISHGNMDAGTFVFELNGIRWVIDPGNQNYYPLNKIGFELSNSKQDSERWTLLTKNNFGHSIVTVNNELFNVKGNVPVVDFKDDEIPKATFDLTELYMGNIKSLKRTFIKENNQSLLIEDQFEINEATQMVTWQLMTVADVEPTKNGAILKQDGKILNLSILSPENLKISIISLDPAPLKIDKQIKNLKRIEIRIPAYFLKGNGGLLQVRLSDKKSN
ncbi:heparinase II/III domain-containing protein [Mariniflexile sp.]|uniref:heparinase II/III domain-containing protein n=1 Tax=Mariniflexile sp. TaxID=1979402 RepID=UPI004048DFE6